jgi:hypothetical protein
MRLCLKCSLLFAILIGLSSAFAQPSPTGSDSIVVFAPHPDDEVIGCAGIMMQALAPLATGIVGPNAKERHSSSLAPTQRSEYRQVHSGETFTTHFDVELSSISKSVLGAYRLNAVRAHVYESDSVEQNSGCAVFVATSAPFTVQ